MRVNSVEPLGHGWGCLLRQRAESQESGLHICREKELWCQHGELGGPETPLTPWSCPSLPGLTPHLHTG